MIGQARHRVVLLLTGAVDRSRVSAVLRWARALVPAAVLVVSPVDGRPKNDVPEDAITIDLDELPSGPLSLADALARATLGYSRDSGEGRCG
jgi:hypothetical protein